MKLWKQKKCTACGSILPISEFSHHPKTADGLCNVCMSCRSAKISKGKKKQQPGTNPKLAQFKPRELMDELRARGYKGTLTYVQEIKL